MMVILWPPSMGSTAMERLPALSLILEKMNARAFSSKNFSAIVLPPYALL